MKYTSFILTILVLAIAISHPSYCGEVSVAFGPTPSPGVLATKDDLFLNASRFKFMEIRMMSDKSYATGRMFFRRIGDPGFNYYNSFEFQTGWRNMYHGYLIDLDRNTGWSGTVSQMLLSPINSEGRIEIESVRFHEPGAWLAARSLWQEFFTFEMPQMRTVNFIYGQKINGVSVYVYAYCLIILISIFILSMGFFKNKDFYAVLKSSSVKILIVCLAFWVAIDLRVLFDQARTAALDAQTFLGKTLEEKRAMTTLGDFYGFLAFSDSKIPKGLNFNILHPSYYYYSQKAAYYLYPRIIENNAAYTLVYNPDGSQDKAVEEHVKKGYRIFSVHKKGEYILKK